MPLGILGPGKATKGNDPRARRPAVSRGHTRRCRSGSTGISFTRLAKATWWDFVRCDVPLTSYRGLTYVLHQHCRTAAGLSFPLYRYFKPALVRHFDGPGAAIGVARPASPG